MQVNLSGMKKLYVVSAGLLLLASRPVVAQDSSAHNISTYLHVGKNVKKSLYSEDPADIELNRIKFRLNFKKEWYSDTVQALSRDEKGYLVKVSLPENINQQTDMLSCTMLLYEKTEEPNSGPVPKLDRSIRYGGVDINNIVTLKIDSDPAGAEVYIIPNSEWPDIEKTDWKHNISKYWLYRPDVSKTSTKISIDQTVYVIIFKLGDRYDIKIHYTKPKAVENPQSVSTEFK
jgi:hypothetical protein